MFYDDTPLDAVSGEGNNFDWNSSYSDDSLAPVESGGGHAKVYDEDHVLTICTNCGNFMGLEKTGNPWA